MWHDLCYQSCNRSIHMVLDRGKLKKIHLLFLFWEVCGLNFVCLCFFFFPELQSLSGPELNETCQLLDKFLGTLDFHFPLLSTIRFGQGTYCIKMLYSSIKWIQCENHGSNTATYYQQLKEPSPRGNTSRITTWSLCPWIPLHLWERLGTNLIISPMASTAPPQTVSSQHISQHFFIFVLPHPLPNCISETFLFFQVACLAFQASAHQSLAVANQIQSFPTLWFQVSSRKSLTFISISSVTEFK